MNKLRSNQIFAVLLGSAAFPLLCRTEPFTIEGIFGAAIATAVQLLLCIPILLLYRTGFCFGECARRHRILPLCFIVYLLFRGGTSFVQLQQTSQEISLPFSEKFLAAALIAPVDLLILDEPTNHIDNDTVDCLEKHLEKYSKALLMVTHDRYFLDRVANRTLELEQGKLSVLDAVVEE